MTLINIEELEFEQFNFGSDENPELVGYISEETIMNAPRVDPVNHAKWVMIVKGMYTEDNKLSITHRCSNCNYLDHVDMVPTSLWELGYKDQYNPVLHNFCADCGYKMDLE